VVAPPLFTLKEYALLLALSKGPTKLTAPAVSTVSRINVVAAL
jgi:hypothetical protein